MNIKRAHSNYIIAELKSQLAHCEEVQKQQHKELLAHQDLQLSQSKEISRLKALFDDEEMQRIESQCPDCGADGGTTCGATNCGY